MGVFTCPYCGKSFDVHQGDLCPVLDAAMTKQLRAAVAFLERERDEKVKALALSSSITPRMYPLDNTTIAATGKPNAQMILGFNLNRGIALVYNDDAADIWLGEDAQHVADASKRFPLKTKCALALSSPNELWAWGNAAGPQTVSVLELPGGRAASEYAGLFKLA